MNANRDASRIVRSWIREEENDSADRVLQVVLSRLDSTPQRRSWWPARRFRSMRNPLRIAVAAAAVVMLAVVVTRFIPAAPSVGAPTPSPIAATVGPSAGQTASPVPSRSPAALRGGPLPAGRYRLRVNGSDVEAVLTIDAGWSGGGADGGLRETFFISSETRGALSFWKVDDVGSDACDLFGTLGTTPIGGTVDDLVAALAAQRNSDTTAPVDVTVGGYSGKRFTIRPSDVRDCDDPKWWTSPFDLWRGAEADESVPDDLYVVDVDGSRVVIVAWISGSAADFAAMLDSLELARG